ncbi:MAG: hypothetical protein KAS92_09300 [Candidatus Omnitrophica bacterium]|nr:hypothetical protein [Candidatus Omnitrophota bacterium]
MSEIILNGEANLMKKLLLVMVCVMLVGCATGEANRYYLEERFATKKLDEVEVLYEKPQKPYVVMAEFQAGNASYKHMRKRAAEIGADAVIIKHLGGYYSRDEVWADKDRHSNTYSRLAGIAIIYKTE